MKKIALLVGAAAGFILGSKAGSGPYKQLEARLKGVMGRSEVQETVEQVKSAVKDQAGAVMEKLPGSGDTDGSEATGIEDVTLPPAPGVYGAS